MPDSKSIKNLTAILILLFSNYLSGSVFAQTTTVRGSISDAKTGESIPFVSVFFEGSSAGKTTDFNGQYFIETSETVTRLRFSILGYKTEFRDVKPGESTQSRNKRT
jgi:hypothetical protein